MTTHWKCIDESAGVYVTTYQFANEGFANCFVAKGPEGLVALSPASRLPDAAFAELDAIGNVAAVVAPNGFHHLGLGPWRERYEDARYFAPPLAAARIAKKSDDAPPLEDIAGLSEMTGDRLVVRPAPHTRCGEIWAWANGDNGAVWFGSDILANMESLPSSFVPRQLFKMTGSAPGYRLFGLALMFILKRKKENLSLMLNDLKAFPPTVMVPGHGAVLTDAGIGERTIGIVEAGAS